MVSGLTALTEQVTISSVIFEPNALGQPYKPLEIRALDHMTNLSLYMSDASDTCLENNVMMLWSKDILTTTS